MLVDILIILAGVSAIYRGRSSGFVRQFCAAIGFFGGLFIGSLLQPYTVKLVQTTEMRAFVLMLTTMGFALIGLSIGEYLGLLLKRRFFEKKINKLDNVFGSILNVTALMISVWLLASIVSGLPFDNIKAAARDSRIISGLNHILPPAPDVIAGIGHLIDPNGFPDVFIGNEPVPQSKVNLPALGELGNAVKDDKDSVLRIVGQGCGGLVSGSGFVVGKGLVATNAHVVAGISRPYVQDTTGAHQAKVIWYNPDLDFAVLKVNNLPEASLTIASGTVKRGTAAAVLGYPGGGGFNADPAAVLNEFNAVGRNIYGSGHTVRDVYAVKANIIPGNSGGPLVTSDGQVIGIVFAESTSYNHVGYALTTSQFNKDLKQALTKTQSVSTGTCAAD